MGRCTERVEAVGDSKIAEVEGSGLHLDEDLMGIERGDGARLFLER